MAVFLDEFTAQQLKVAVNKKIMLVKVTHSIIRKHFQETVRETKVFFLP